MFSLFRKNKPTINSISIPNFGWNLNKKDDSIKQWINQEKTIALSINFFKSPPDLPSIHDIEKIRHYYRNQIVEANGGLIQVDIINIDDFKTIKTIFKVYKENLGVTYLASLTIPFGTCSYVIKIQAPETGVTGVRDNRIADQLLKEKVISIDNSGYVGWDEDPYLKGFKSGVPMNISEKLDYDKDFPNHALSISRKLIRQIEVEIELTQELKKIKKFNK
jgi:hypothetical protein